MNKALFVIVAALLLILNCSNSGGGDIAGTITETQNAGLIRGKVTNADGSPAVNAMVRFVAKDHDPGAGSTVSLRAKDSCLTDENGYYATDSLECGTWNILATNANNQAKVFVDSIVFTGDSLKVEDAALSNPGAVRGTVRVQRGDDPRTVSVYVIGALAYSMVETDGGFNFSSMAKGRYKLRFRASDPKYEILDTVVDVASGINKLIDSPVVLPLKIPAPTGLKLSYDTLKQTVTLQWDAMNPLKVAGYNIYRQQVDSAERKLNALPFKGGVVYIDSTAFQDLRYVYKVASVDSLGNEGSLKAVYKDTVTIKPAFDLVATFGGPGTGDGKFTEISDLKLIDENRLLVLDRGANRVQIFDTAGIFITSWGSYGDADGQFNVPISATFDELGNIYVLELLGSGRIQKFDALGKFLTSWTIGTLYNGITYNLNKLFIAGPPYRGMKILDLITNELISKPIQMNITISKIASQSVNNSLFLSDILNNKIIVADTNANVLNVWGGTGISDGKFNYISSMSIISDNNILITDKDNGRIQFLDFLGNLTTKIHVPSRYFYDFDNTPEYKPVCSAMTKDGKVLYCAIKTGILKYLFRSKYERNYDCPPTTTPSLEFDGTPFLILNFPSTSTHK